MKIIIISQYNIFSSVGGTEYYVNMLIEGLMEKGHDIVFITMGTQKKEKVTRKYAHKEHHYKCVFLPEMNFTNSEIQQDVVSSTWQEMLPILLQEEPDIIHAHTLTTFFNIRHFEECKKHFNNLIFTSHIPAHFCPQGDLIKFNKAPCDGLLYNRCSFCMFASGPRSGIGHLYHSTWKKFLKRMQRMNQLDIKLVCVSEWQKEHAIGNGYPEHQISVIRQAIAVENYQYGHRKKNSGKFTIGFLGRLSKEKGVSLLYAIVRKLLIESNYLFVLSFPKGSNPKYELLFRDLSKNSPERLILMEDINTTNKEVFFNRIDCLLIPSWFIETGPIVLLEALLFNKQVIAPNVGGPVEFQPVYTDQITTYQWNCLSSAIETIKAVEKKDQTGIDNLNFLRNRETIFIELHQRLYEHILHTKMSDYQS